MASAVRFIDERLRRQFGEGVTVEHIEIFSQRSFEFPTVLGAIQRGANLPIVLIRDRIISQGEKLSKSRIARAVELLGVTAGSELRRE